MLDERELEGVIAHELAHVNHLDILISSVAATVAATIMMLARMAQFAADRGAAQIVGSPYGRADALRKIQAHARRVPMNANPATAHMFIVKPLSGRGMMSLFSTHPPTEQRVQRLLGTV